MVKSVFTLWILKRFEQERLYTITGITPASQILACPEATSLNSDTAQLGTCHLDVR